MKVVLGGALNTMKGKLAEIQYKQRLDKMKVVLVENDSHAQPSNYLLSSKESTEKSLVNYN